MTDEEILSYFHESWYDLVIIYMKNIKRALRQTGTIYPDQDRIFRVFSMPLEDISVVILGQDPYHGPGQATGLAFDCTIGKNIQPSVRNIFKEISGEFPERNYKFTNGSLERWFDEEHIFLLNTALTVLEHKPGSHLKFWGDFINATIQYIADYNPTCIFLLMGKPAQYKTEFIASKSIHSKKELIKRHTRIIMCVHPSPLSANRGFFGSDVFKEIEERIGYEINWQN